MLFPSVAFPQAQVFISVDSFTDPTLHTLDNPESFRNHVTFGDSVTTKLGRRQLRDPKCI